MPILDFHQFKLADWIRRNVPIYLFKLYRVKSKKENHLLSYVYFEFDLYRFTFFDFFFDFVDTLFSEILSFSNSNRKINNNNNNVSDRWTGVRFAFDLRNSKIKRQREAKPKRKSRRRRKKPNTAIAYTRGISINRNASYRIQMCEYIGYNVCSNILRNFIMYINRLLYV